MLLREHGFPVTVADLDIVNPYFRTLDSEEVFREHGIKLICSQFANSNVDAPAMPKEVYNLIDSRSEYGVLDIGGDDRGALALGRYVPSIIEENDYEMLLVINKARPLTRNVPDTLEVVGEMVAACGLSFTGIVNNTNLGPETTAEDVLASVAYASEVSEALGIPVKMTCCDEKLYEKLKDRIENLFPLSLQKLYYHLNSKYN
ncbi:MAG: hypothetical protein IJE28_10395 [Oscillospiraceae bacterium]|nr:hypothetical protein [Oscillospiraceae bacterium]